MISNRKTLERECQVFTKYLLDCPPHGYVTGKYVEAHQVSPVFTEGDRFDGLLLHIARLSPGVCRLADSYACRFAPNGLLRKKLVLSLAILETCSPFYKMIDSTRDGSWPIVVLRLMRIGCISVLGLILGAVLFAPFHLALGRASRRSV